MVTEDPKQLAIDPPPDGVEPPSDEELLKYLQEQGGLGETIERGTGARDD